MRRILAVFNEFNRRNGPNPLFRSRLSILGQPPSQPDQIELEVIIKNGVLILCELKSSFSKPDMYTFDRKVSFYETKHQREASQKLVISPMIDRLAAPVAKKLGIECYSDSIEVEVL
jgi:hypothetical protein